ncbi:rod shape-determining protein RodA [Segetibacter sp.]|jgi:rod shape determining protein RodA|uniref:rod shape-determining protein RodA n=1 Tax=Segetibacter sp. TaxID=2231182 RepID=UPI002627899F|nr:rod shape-determining protein RodA [Segetibacter sp.]MCW3079144.1 rod shape-determining protein RodA [Segetibacter sp.]
MTNNNTISKGVDWSMIILYGTLVIIGLLMIFANEYKEGESIFQPVLSQSKDYGKQALWAGICSVLAVFILLTDSKFFTATANLLYGVGIVLCLAALVIGSEVKGSKSWLVLGGFRLQPSELCKVFTCLALAKYISRQETDFSRTKSQVIGAAISLLPAIITVAQNETGLALVYFSFFLAMYREGLPPFILITGASLAVILILSLIVAPNTLFIAYAVLAVLTIFFCRGLFKRNRALLWIIIVVWAFASVISSVAIPYLINNVMKPYQRDRIYSLVGKPYIPQDPEERAELERVKAKTRGRTQNQSEYNVIQSKIAIGSGGWTGKGYLKGTQTRYDFVPEQRTDFIFCTVGEGFGFLGSIAFLCLYAILLFRIVIIAERQRSIFSRVYAYGVASVFFFHITINICMTIGLAPVIGIPLPLISYGGSSLLTFTILLFILIRLDADRQMILR